MMIKKWMIVPIMGLVWLLALLYGSGIGQTYDVYGKAKLLVIALTLYHIFMRDSLRKMPENVVLLSMYIIAVGLYTDFMYNKTMYDYVWLYLLVPLIGLLPVHEKQMRWVSIMYGGLGMAVLFIYNYASSFSNWNPNSLAMIALFSFAVMIVSFNKTNEVKTLAFLGIYMMLFFVWSGALNSRSGILFAIFMVLGVFGVIPMRRILKKKAIIYLLLLFPLAVALFVVSIRNLDFVQELEVWSIQTFSKPIFNGRDMLWNYGFDLWKKHFFIGNGNLSADSWHNSAVTMLVGGGIIGYILWIAGNATLLGRGSEYVDDNIVLGLMIGFITIWLQQTVELGLVAGKANAIPYAMLGLMLGRIRTLKK